MSFFQYAHTVIQLPADLNAHLNLFQKGNLRPE
jgi:hypothetical protein